MPKINNTRLLSQIVRALGLDALIEKTPDQLAKQIVPVFEINPKPRIIEIEDVVANNSSKVLTVPAGKQWKFLYGRILFTTTATAGNRHIEVLIQDASNNNLYQVRALNVQIASTVEAYSFGQFSDATESATLIHLLPMPVNLLMNEGFRIAIADLNAVDAAADDLQIRFMVEESDMNPEL